MDGINIVMRKAKTPAGIFFAAFHLGIMFEASAERDDWMTFKNER